MSVIPDPDRHRRARESAEPSTFHQHGQSAAGDESLGRFAATGAPKVTGSTPIPYSDLPPMPASSPWAGTQPGPGDEPPLSAYENPALASPTGMSQPVATGGPPANEQSEADLAVSFDRGDGGPSPLSNGDPAASGNRSPAPARNVADVPMAGSPPSHKEQSDG
jgi:hypothetical protein